MKYKVKRQSPVDERIFTLEREDGDIFYVDIFTDGGLEPPNKYHNEEDTIKANIIFEDWLKSFVGKTLEIEKIYPLIYSTSGKIKDITPNPNER